MDLLILDNDLVDQQPNVGLAQSRVITPETVAEQNAESADDLRRNRALVGLQLPFQRLNVRRERRNASSMKGEALTKIAIGG